ncbi:23S ribosomal RNA methyltransferase Erm [Catenulispora subtropica]|uniref:Ribosomal RNA adenine methylase transferase N-terminal domain-containing protein n=1 Tax=Catenulispora subtropica TaxID=450798 RepID=A0ABN2RU34_9ACTN
MQHHRVGGRHELGQNFLADRGLVAAVQRLVGDETAGPIVEIGAGDGALTAALARLGRPVTALEIDPRRVRRLRERFGDAVAVVQADVLRHRFPAAPHTVVGNIPFHLTTSIIRKLMAEPGWRHGVLIVQWEVARRRAGVGGASLLTASWWPWYEFGLDRRIPAAAFRPVPSVDGGLLTMRRRAAPLVPADDRGAYQDFVRQVFQAPGRGLGEMLARSGRLRPEQVREWTRGRRVPARALPKDLSAQDWAELWRLSRPRPGSARTTPPPAPRRCGRGTR